MALLGASTDPERTNARFAEVNRLSYPLLSDPGGRASRALGIRNLIGFANRTTFLIDGTGVVRRVWENVSINGHAREVTHAALELTRLPDPPDRK